MNIWLEAIHLVNRVLEAAPMLPFIALWLRRSTITYKFRPVAYYIEFEFMFYILDVVSRAVFRNNVYIFHVSTAIAVALISATYYRLFLSSRIKKYIKISLVIFVFIAFFDAAFLNGLFTDVNSYSQAFGSILLVSLALLHIMRVSRTSLYLENQPDFFFSIAVLVYFSYTIVTYVATNIIYNSGYDVATTVRLDDIVSSPDTILFAIQMGLFAWMFSFFPLDIAPLRALPYWLHYSRWHPRAYKLLGQKAIVVGHLTTTAEN